MVALPPARHLRRTPRLALVLALLLATVVCLPGVASATVAASTGTVGDWPQLQGDERHSGVATDPTLTRAALSRLHQVWSRPLGPFGSSGAVVGAGLAYVGDEGVTAVHLADGSTAWHTPLPVSTGDAAGMPAVGDGVVVIGAYLPTARPGRRGAVWGLAADTGAVLWRRTVADGVFVAPAVYRGGVFVTSGGHLVKLWLHSGAVAWVSPVAAQSPASLDGGAAVVSDQGLSTGGPLTVSGVDVRSGAVAWSRPLRAQGGCGGWQAGTVLVDEHHVGTVGDCYGDLRSLVTRHGQVVWKAGSDGLFWPMALSPANLLLVTNGAMGVDRSTGAVVWRSGASDGGAYGPTAVVVGDTELLPGAGFLDLREPTTGALLGTVAVPGSSFLEFPAVAEGHVLVISVDPTGAQSLVALAPA